MVAEMEANMVADMVADMVAEIMTLKLTRWPTWSSVLVTQLERLKGAKDAVKQA